MEKRSSVSTWKTFRGSFPIFPQHAAEDGYSGGCDEDSPHRVGTRCDVHGGGKPRKIIREQNKMLSQKGKTRLPKFKEKMFVCNFGIYRIPKSPASEQNPATKSLVDTGLPDCQHAWKLRDDDSQFNLHIPGSSFCV